SYDYLAPEAFRISTTALSAGTTLQWVPAKAFVLEGNLLGGCGYGGVGTIADVKIDRDYHYGVTPPGPLPVRTILFERVMADFSAREYYLHGNGSDFQHGSDNVFQWRAAVTLDLLEGHSIGAFYVNSSRDAFYDKAEDRHQKVAAY